MNLNLPIPAAGLPPGQLVEVVVIVDRNGVPYPSTVQPASLGQKPTTGSMPVVIASDQTPIATTSTPPADSSSALVPQTAHGASALLLKGSAGNVFGYKCTAGATAGFVHLLDLAAVPATGAAIDAATVGECWPLAAQGALRFSWDQRPLRFTKGVVVLFSTSATSYVVPTNLPVLLGGEVV